MGIKELIAGGIGFKPGSIRFILTRGFIAPVSIAKNLFVPKTVKDNIVEGLKRAKVVRR